MQVTMFGVFLATLGLAMLLAQSRERAVAVELETKPHLTDYLAIRLPKGWLPPDQDAFELPMEVVSKERTNGNLDKARVVAVYQTDAPPANAEALLKRYIGRSQGQLGELEPFMLLGEPGVIARFWVQVVPDDAMEGGKLIPAWYAAGILPGKGPKGGDLGIVIGVHGMPAAGPAGRHLVRQVADGLILRGRGARR
jgi:hypothetical protein